MNKPILEKQAIELAIAAFQRSKKHTQVGCVPNRPDMGFMWYVEGELGRNPSLEVVWRSRDRFQIMVLETRLDGDYLHHFTHRSQVDAFIATSDNVSVRVFEELNEVADRAFIINDAALYAGMFNPNPLDDNETVVIEVGGGYTWLYRKSIKRLKNIQVVWCSADTPAGQERIQKAIEYARRPMSGGRGGKSRGSANVGNRIAHKQRGHYGGYRERR